MDRLVESIYDACADSARWPLVLQQVVSLCSARAAVVVTSDDATGEILFADEIGLDPGYRRPYLHDLRFADLRLQDLLRQPLGVVRTDCMIERYDDYVTSAAYRELYAKLGTEHALGALLAEVGGGRRGLRLFRPAVDGPFGQPEILRYRRLAPHLARALRLRHEIEAMQREQATTTYALDLLPFAFLVSHGGRDIRPLNRRAADLLTTGLRLTLAGHLERARGAWRSGSLRPLVVPLVGQGLSQLRIDRVGASPPARRLPAERMPALLTLTGEATASGRQTVVGRLRELHGLTASEAALAAALASGESLNEAAHELGIGRETARFHLRNVFAKTGTRRQPALVRLILAGLASLGQADGDEPAGLAGPSA